MKFIVAKLLIFKVYRRKIQCDETLCPHLNRIPNSRYRFTSTCRIQATLFFYSSSNEWSRLTFSLIRPFQRLRN